MSRTRTDRFSKSIQENVGTEPDRRQVARALLGALGGAAFLDACAAGDAPDALPPVGELVDALTGTNVRWVDAIGTTPVTGTNLNLRGHVGSNSAAFAVALGFSSRGDGGGGIFAWITTSAIDDGGTIIVANQAADSTTPGPHWKRIYSGALNVRWFGAKGDGTTPDQLALQRAIDAAESPVWPAGGRPPVFLPRGVYRIEASVNIDSDVTVRGEGEQSQIFVPGVTEPAYDIFVLKGHRNTISDLCFKGENGSENGAGFDKGALPGLTHQRRAIDMELASMPHHDITVTRCWFKNLFGFSIHNQDTFSERFRFTHNVCRYTSNGINVSGRDVDISHNTIRDAEGIETASDHCMIAFNNIRGFMASISSGGRTTPPASRNNTIIGNTIDLSEETAERAAIVVPGSTDVIISGNTILNCPGVAIQVLPEPTPPSGANVSKRVTISGNTIANERTSGPAQARGIFLSGVSDVVIQGNVIQGVDSYPSGYYVQYAILVTFCSDITIDHNILRVSGTGGVYLQDTTNAVITGNRIHDFFVGIDMVNVAGANLLGNIVADCDVDVRSQAGCSELRLVANRWGTASLASGIVYSAGNSS